VDHRCLGVKDIIHQGELHFNQLECFALVTKKLHGVILKLGCPDLVIHELTHADVEQVMGALQNPFIIQ
jgi:hypothetical protein